jgi:glutamine synthetase
METLVIQIEAHHHVVATAGQAEIDMRFTTTFMPKPIRVQSGSSFVRPIISGMDIWRLQRC